MTWPDDRVSSLADDLIQRRRRACVERFREQDAAIARRHSNNGTLFTTQVFFEVKALLHATFAEFGNGMTTDLLELMKAAEGDVRADVTRWIAERVEPVLAADAETLVSGMSGGPPHRVTLKS